MRAGEDGKYILHIVLGKDIKSVSSIPDYQLYLAVVEIQIDNFSSYVFGELGYYIKNPTRVKA